MTGLRGIIPYLPTPLCASPSGSGAGARVDAQAVSRVVFHVLRAGVDGLSPLGSTGEVMYLTPEQRVDMVHATVAASRDFARAQGTSPVPVIAGVAAFSIEGIRQQIVHYEAAGAAGFVVIMQRYFPLTDAEQYAFYAAAAQATDLPIVVYSNPLLGATITPDLAERLTAIPNVRYIKDASGKTGTLLSIQNRVGDRFGIFAASAHIPAAVFELGGIGWMAGPACVAPHAAVALWRSWGRRDRSRMWQIQRAMWPLNEMFSQYSAAAFIKFALNEQELHVGVPCPPQSAISGTAAESVRARLKAVARDLNELSLTL